MSNIPQQGDDEPMGSPEAVAQGQLVNPVENAILGAFAGLANDPGAAGPPAFPQAAAPAQQQQAAVPVIVAGQANLAPRRIDGPARKKRRREGQQADEGPPDQKNNPFAPLRALADKVKVLVTRANALLEEMNATPADVDAQAIYGKYQESKQQLVDQIQKLVQLQSGLAQFQQEVAQYESDIDQNILVDPQELKAFQESFNADFDALEEAVDTLEQQMRQQVLQTRKVRDDFKIPPEMTTQADFDNYYGVYFYNVLVNACKQVVQTLYLLPPAVPGIHDAQDLFVAVIDNEVAQETAKQTTYLLSIQKLQTNIEEKKLTDDYKGQLQKWQAEITAVNQRLAPNGILKQCSVLALNAMQQNSAVNRVAERSMVYWLQDKAKDKILTNIVGTRMFENDILPQQLALQPDVKKEYAPAFNALPMPQKAEASKLAAQDIAWRQTSVLEKQRLLGIASVWAEEAGIPANLVQDNSDSPDVFGRLLDGVLGHLGLQIWKVGDLELKTISLAWDEKEVYTAMQDSCKQSPEQKIQFVMQEDVWKDVLLMMQGKKDVSALGEDAVFFVLIGPGNKYFGLLQTRNVQKDKDLTKIMSQMTRFPKNPWKEGVPQPDAKEKCLEITFLCTQRSRDGYLLRQKPPKVGLGILLMLYAFRWFSVKAYMSTMLEVVGTVGGGASKNAPNTEGYSTRPSNSRIAAFYQRHFKYQRSGPLSEFSSDSSLGFFHPDWNVYSIPVGVGQNRRQLQVMYRPYPTWPDLADTLARLVRDVQNHYG